VWLSKKSVTLPKIGYNLENIAKFQSCICIYINAFDRNVYDIPVHCIQGIPMHLINSSNPSQGIEPMTLVLPGMLNKHAKYTSTIPNAQND